MPACVSHGVSAGVGSLRFRILLEDIKQLPEQIRKLCWDIFRQGQFIPPRSGKIHRTLREWSNISDRFGHLTTMVSKGEHAIGRQPTFR